MAKKLFPYEGAVPQYWEVVLGDFDLTMCYCGPIKAKKICGQKLRSYAT